MDSELQKLRARAATQADVFAAHPLAEVVLVTGSVALGVVDEASDIDLMVYYQALPPAGELTAMRDAALANDGGVYSFNPDEGLACFFFVDGIRIDVAHQSRAGLEQMLADFVREAPVGDDTRHIIMSGIRQALPLHGADVVAGWQRQLDALPDSYYEALLRANLRFPPRAVLQQMGVDRGDLWLVNELLLESQKRILNVLCGLNRRIPPGKIKGLDHTVDALPIRPADAANRLRQLWLLPPADAVGALFTLIAELLDLVAAQRPDIDTDALRRRIAMPLRLPQP